MRRRRGGKSRLQSARITLDDFVQGRIQPAVVQIVQVVVEVHQILVLFGGQQVRHQLQGGAAQIIEAAGRKSSFQVLSWVKNHVNKIFSSLTYYRRFGKDTVKL